MWTRKELKERGKAAFKANYWRCVLVALILALLAGGVGGVSGYRSSHQISESQSQTQTDTLQQDLSDLTQSEIDPELQQSIDDLNQALSELPEEEASAAAGAIFAIIAGVIAIAFAVGFILSILLFNPLQVGCQRFFTQNSKERAELNEMGYGFGRGGYGRVVKTMLITDIFLILWTLLFIIPGLIKSYSYRMVPYILAQEPEISGRDAINRSREMMDGHKWNTFVLDLSFILWILLTIVTLGIVGVFYVNPYYYATNAELYYTLSGKNSSTDPMLG